MKLHPIKFMDGNEVVEDLTKIEVRFIQECTETPGGRVVHGSNPRLCRRAEDLKDLGFVRCVNRVCSRTYWVATEKGCALLRLKPAHGAWAIVVPASVLT